MNSQSTARPLFLIDTEIAEIKDALICNPLSAAYAAELARIPKPDAPGADEGDAP